MSRLPPPAEWVVLGRVGHASNATFVVEVESRRFAYKPVAGEAPLWDFPSATLSRREVATAVLDRVLGWGLVPDTVWVEEGPFGPGSLQEWIDEAEQGPVGWFPAAELPAGLVGIARGRDQDGLPLVLAHERSDALRRMALLDAVANNADRKGGHVLRDRTGRVLGIDHGVCFHTEPKLRTVLWGFVGDRIPAELRGDLEALTEPGALSGLDHLLSRAEVVAVVERTSSLLAAGVFPGPVPGWPAVPWPPM